MTGLLVSYMRSNRPEDGVWQTRVLEFNLLTQPNVAETIFQTTDWNQFDRIKIADLCEKKGLFQRSLENYNELKDIKRVMLNTHAIKVEWLVDYFARL